MTSQPETARSVRTVRSVRAVLFCLVLCVPALAGAAGCGGPSAADGNGDADGRKDTTRSHRAAPQPTGTVDLARRITDYTDGITADGSYRIPTERERRAVADGVRALLDGDRTAAGRRLGGVGYAVHTLVDSSGGTRYAEIADATREGEVRRGWGRVYVDLRGPVRWQVQVPHPSADQRTEQLGIGLLRGTPGGVLVLAGAHRAADSGGGPDSADVAHRRDSVFAAVAGALAERRLPAVQVHGFADSSLPDHDVVVSPGKGEEGLPSAVRLAAAYRTQGLRVCEVWERYCGRLEGRTNVEGEDAEEVGVPFLHVEHNRRIRDDDALLAKAVRALAEVAGRWGTGRG
ncbi:hypothetical protein FGW37_25300 [Streptomyces rectiverticillatus]|uniref:hypothetical protein n=1 Tax=Streptomyces rectiverticillatus TaxID=173860 RepID=UPI0015C2C9D5|nr:hypothetical protein [Streptomyces rectiverticillatus]QLE74468.1 hypothetical protein FGW37_25300 [Streptomyces rectiverticillatus]